MCLINNTSFFVDKYQIQNHDIFLHLSWSARKFKNLRPYFVNLPIGSLQPRVSSLYNIWFKRLPERSSFLFSSNVSAAFGKETEITALMWCGQNRGFWKWESSLFDIDFILMSKLTIADICVPMLNYTEPVIDIEEVSHWSCNILIGLLGSLYESQSAIDSPLFSFAFSGRDHIYANF